MEWSLERDILVLKLTDEDNGRLPVIAASMAAGHKITRVLVVITLRHQKLEYTLAGMRLVCDALEKHLMGLHVAVVHHDMAKHPACLVFANAVLRHRGVDCKLFMTETFARLWLKE